MTMSMSQIYIVLLFIISVIYGNYVVSVMVSFTFVGH